MERPAATPTRNRHRPERGCRGRSSRRQRVSTQAAGFGSSDSNPIEKPDSCQSMARAVAQTRIDSIGWASPPFAISWHYGAMSEGVTIRSIRAAVGAHRLRQPFRAADVNRALGINWAGTFLAKHCVGNGYTTEHFVRVSKGLYRLR